MENCIKCQKYHKEFSFSSKFFVINGKQIVVKRIPCIVCTPCDKVFFDTEIVQKIEQTLHSIEYNASVLNYFKIVA